MEHFTWEWQIPVTQEDIDTGRQCNAHFCAVAKAAARGFNPQQYEVCVTSHVHLFPAWNPEGAEIIWWSNHNSYTYIRTFDNNREQIIPTTLSFFLEQ